jgi:hypothetical protein
MAPPKRGGHKIDKLWRDALMLAVKREGEDKRPYLAVMAEKCVLAAAGGDLAAMKEIGDRLDGKAVQATEISGPDGEAVPIGLKVSFVDSGSSGT